MINQARQDIWNGLKQYRGAIQEVVDKTKWLKTGGYSRYHVYLVLSGQRQNISILDIAADVLEAKRNERNEQLRRIHQSAMASVASA